MTWRAAIAGTSCFAQRGIPGSNRSLSRTQDEREMPANDAANAISETAWQTRTFGKYALQKLVYQHVRQTFGLAAQVSIRALAKVGDAYKLDT